MWAALTYAWCHCIVFCIVSPFARRLNQTLYGLCIRALVVMRVFWQILLSQTFVSTLTGYLSDVWIFSGFECMSKSWSLCLSHNAKPPSWLQRVTASLPLKRAHLERGVPPAHMGQLTTLIYGKNQKFVQELTRLVSVLFWMRKSIFERAMADGNSQKLVRTTDGNSITDSVPDIQGYSTYDTVFYLVHYNHDSITNSINARTS